MIASDVLDCQKFMSAKMYGSGYGWPATLTLGRIDNLFLISLKIVDFVSLSYTPLLTIEYNMSTIKGTVFEFKKS